MGWLVWSCPKQGKAPSSGRSHLLLLARLGLGLSRPAGDRVTFGPCACMLASGAPAWPCRGVAVVHLAVFRRDTI